MTGTVAKKSYWRTLFTIFKYVIYCLLALNATLFLIDDISAAAHHYPNGVPLVEYGVAYAVGIDSWSWVLLLLLFELETHVIPDEKIKGLTQFALHGVRIFCACFITYAFYGYATKVAVLYGFTPYSGAELCGLIDQSVSFMTDFDEFQIIEAANCLSLATSQSLFANADVSILADANSLSAAKLLAWTDVVNAGTWLLIVLILEISIRLQHKGLLKGRVLFASNLLKSVLYSILFIAAIYWWIDGTFLDFWDAILWIVAFFFIEMNIFDWQKETSESAAAAADTSSAT